MKNRKVIFLLLYSIFPGLLLAGGPSISCTKVKIHSAVFTLHDIILVVSGVCTTYMLEKPEASGHKSVSMTMKQSQLILGRKAYSLELLEYRKHKSYKKRILALVGQTTSFQAWQTTIEIKWGLISKIFANDFSLLRPIKDEQRKIRPTPLVGKKKQVTK